MNAKLAVDDTLSHPSDGRNDGPSAAALTVIEALAEAIERLLQLTRTGPHDTVRAF